MALVLADGKTVGKIMLHICKHKDQRVESRKSRRAQRQEAATDAKNSLILLQRVCYLDLGSLSEMMGLYIIMMFSVYILYCMN